MEETEEKPTCSLGKQHQESALVGAWQGAHPRTCPAAGPRGARRGQHAGLWEESAVPSRRTAGSDWGRNPHTSTRTVFPNSRCVLEKNDFLSAGKDGNNSFHICALFQGVWLQATCCAGPPQASPGLTEPRLHNRDKARPARLLRPRQEKDGEKRPHSCVSGREKAEHFHGSCREHLEDYACGVQGPPPPSPA